jgi:methionyl-tRNA formyltransferase
MDAGPVYARRALALDGRAQEIYERAAALATGMMQDIVRDAPVPEPQQGEAVTFTRRTPADSRVPDAMSADQLFDFIRMLDADGYPRAFLDHGDWRIEFSNARLDGADVRADVRLTRAFRRDS